MSKLRFSLPEPGDWQLRWEELKLLKAPLCLLALASVHSGLPFSASECDAWVESATASSLGWPAAMRTWRMLRRKEPTTFRASCIRDGQHQFNALRVARAVAGAFHDRFGLQACMVGSDCEVIALVLQHELLLGISLCGEARGFRGGGRLPAEPRPLLPFCE
jgi:hypothetical protein